MEMRQPFLEILQKICDGNGTEHDIYKLEKKMEKCIVNLLQ